MSEGGLKLYLASAGTGKTHALVEEVVGLLERGVPLRRIAALSFTRKAAEELRSRIRERVEGLKAPWAEEARREVYGAVFTTIHGFLAEALRYTAPYLGLDPDFEVLEAFAAKEIFLAEAKSLLYLRPKGPREEDLEALRLLYEKRSAVEAYRPADEEAEAVLGLYEEVLGQVRRHYPSALGPAELEEWGLRLVQHPLARARLVQRFPYILVDEYQDTSRLQARIFEGLRAAGACLILVGDPKQSIYLFRNARVEGFLEMARAAEGLGVIRPLDRTFRHTRPLAEFLNRAVAGLFREEAQRGQAEVWLQRVVPAPQPGRDLDRGGVEVHWVQGDKALDLDRLRDEEAFLLVDRLKALRAEGGYPYGAMAVLVRGRNSLPHLEKAFRAQGVPYRLGRGQGFFRRLEVRDLYHALRAGLLEGPPRTGEERMALLAFLRGPWFTPEEQEALWRAEGAILAHLAGQGELPPLALARLREVQAELRKPPLEALLGLMHLEPFRSQLSPRARLNLDTLVFLASRKRFPHLEALLDWLRLKAEDPEASENPEAGEGVALLTVHGAKGLEWPVVAVFDLGRSPRPETPLVLVDLEDGRVALKGSPAYAPLKEKLRAWEEAEERRLLYVALSRAREVLLLTGSFKEDEPRGKTWAAQVWRLLGGEGLAGVRVQPHPVQALSRPRPAPRLQASPGPLDPYPGRGLFSPPYPRLRSPSAWRRALPLWDPEGEAWAEEPGEEAQGLRARAVGILTHWAIAQDLRPGAEALRVLEVQEVLLPFAAEERAALLDEVMGLLWAYWGLMAQGVIHPLERREEDYAELPWVFPQGEAVWHGVLDRVYRVGQRWFLEDYKTDGEVRLEAYRLQLALYREALRRAWGVEAEARLVYLRLGQVLTLDPAELEEALNTTSL